jgi:hypothetical protein
VPKRLNAPASSLAGDPSKVHKNKNVKFDFDLRNNSTGESVSFYCESEAEAHAWMFSIQFVIDKLAEVEAALAAGVDPELISKGPTIGAGPGGAAAPGQWSEQQQQGTPAGGLPLSAPGLGASGDPRLPSAEERLQAAIDAAQAHTAYGSGLCEAVRGEPASFFIQVRAS